MLLFNKKKIYTAIIQNSKTEGICCILVPGSADGRFSFPFKTAPAGALPSSPHTKAFHPEHGFSFSFERRAARAIDRRRWVIRGRRRRQSRTMRRSRCCRRRRSGPKTKSPRGRIGSPTASAWRATMMKPTASSMRWYVVHPLLIDQPRSSRS